MEKRSNNNPPNQLIHENSPYLLQHAYNPVDWRPWNEDTLEQAARENKMLIVSIGYSACHWCHVMERESFEDPAVAELMNAYFIPVKVDREERPDIDDIYMTACHLTRNGGCGWPLNAFSLPDGRPVWAGTYFPREQWIQILRQFVRYQKDEPERLEQAALNLMEGIRQFDHLEAPQNPEIVSTQTIHFQQQALLRRMDPVRGGKTGQPKFPMPVIHEFLLLHYLCYQSGDSLSMLETSLMHMAFGGIYDQIGGGFARYSTDSEWFVPHFEKMLYDNAQLVSLYAKAYRLTRKVLYADTVEQTLAFVLRELRAPGGAFFSALDADSEGEEGKYYLWTFTELRDILGREPGFSHITEFFNLTEKGNWEKGYNIPFRQWDLSEFATSRSLDPDKFRRSLEHARNLLLEKRMERSAPGLDDKILSSWNGLMLRAFAEAYKASGNSTYSQAAMDTGHFIRDKLMHPDARLDRSFKDGTNRINAFLDDYAHVIDGFIGLYEISFDESWLTLAKSLCHYCLTHFYAPGEKVLYYTSDLDRALVTRKTEWTDNVLPGSVSSMAKNLFILGRLFENEKFLNVSKDLLLHIGPSLEKAADPSFYTNWLSLAIWWNNPPIEIVLVGPEAHVYGDTLHRYFLGDILLTGAVENSMIPLLHDKLPAKESLIYVCQNKVCQLPVSTVEEALEQIKTLRKNDSG